VLDRGREILLDRRDHRLLLPAVLIDDGGDVGVEIIVAEEAMEDALGQRVGVQVGRLLGDDQFVHERRRGHQPAQAQGRGHGLGKRAEQDGVGRQQVLERDLAGPGKAQVAVGIVLDHQAGAVPHQIGHRPAVGVAVADAAGVLKIGHRVEQFWPPLAQDPGQGGEVHATLTDRHRVKAGPVHGKGLDGTEVAGLLDDQVVAFVEEGLAQEVQSLLRPGGDEDILHRHLQPLLPAVAIGDELPQPQIAFGIGVLKDVAAFLLKDVMGGLLQGLDRKEQPVGQATGKGDDRGVEGDLEDLADKGFGNIGDAIGEGVFHGIVSRVPLGRAG